MFSTALSAFRPNRTKLLITNHAPAVNGTVFCPGRNSSLEKFIKKLSTFALTDPYKSADLRWRHRLAVDT